ncbi:unnamed protein product [Adineta steineri]|uniref:Peptidase C1A papain C-terminal domain-containing protein n=1 Tax=Adineta steineri TaxID=433720 RepID=A0A814WYQ2_9BILA|nr:unnamed protein product [Adineta steineri]CAF1292275.1 unnamed protein product [Adineta steineri]CAF4025917.1 unnamed protein product [Adineta steineri]CAF4116043.1 unnamed protein product [Adineta steineri]
MDLPEFRTKMTGYKSDQTIYIKSLSMQRQKRFLFDSIKKRVKKIKNKINQKIHPGRNRTDDSDTFVDPGQPVTRKNKITRRPTSTATANSMLDYRPYMNPIENQGQCGSCYAFAVTAAIEGTYAIKTGARIKLSQQQLVDCSPNYGCSGGFFGTTFDYIKQSGGLQSDASYPYVASRQSCSSTSGNVGTIQGYGNTPPNDEEEMKRALITYGPLAAAICVTSDLQFYGPSQQSGASDIIDIPSCPKQVDHAIAIVGYGTEKGQDYWLVRNSWGENWGLDGYFKVARNKDGMCGIATYSYYTQL